MVTINDERATSAIDFSDLGVSDTFMYKGNLYMVVDFPTDDTWFNALRLCDGTHHEMNDDDEVQEVNVTITVTNV